MTTTVYPIHRAIGRPILFKGFKEQYILFAVVALIADLLLFVLLYCSGVLPWLCIGLTAVLGALALLLIRRYSDKYGRYGFSKHAAAKRFPRYIRYTSRQPFLHLKKQQI